MERQTITMSEEAQQRAHLLTRWIARDLAPADVADLLDLSERQAWRLKARFLREGPGALVHGNCGRPSARRVPAEVRAKVVELGAGKYDGANDSHLTELLDELEDIHLARVTVRRIRRAAGQPSPRRHRPPRHRRRRERMPQAGLLLQLDGSRHDWLQGRGPWLTLVGAIDDATSEVVGATFRDEEDSAGYLELMRDIVRDHGIPPAIYRDHHGAFEPTRPRRGQSAEERRIATHLGRALARLGIRSIPAASPQAKGRVERGWGTDQDRLVLLLRLAGACDRESANRVLAEYLPKRNQRFAVAPASPEPGWRPLPADIDLDEVFAFHYSRVVANDHTVRIAGLALQLPALRGGRGYARRRVDVQVRLDGRIVVALGDEVLLTTEPLLDAARLRDPDEPHANPLAELAPRALDRAGYAPGAAHPWRRVHPSSKLGRQLAEQPGLTDSLTR